MCVSVCVRESVRERERLHENVKRGNGAKGEIEQRK